jgi:hypothetical protein
MPIDCAKHREVFSGKWPADPRDSIEFIASLRKSRREFNFSWSRDPKSRHALSMVALAHAHKEGQAEEHNADGNECLHEPPMRLVVVDHTTRCRPKRVTT